MSDTSPWAAPGGPAQPASPATPFSPSSPPPPTGQPLPPSGPPLPPPSVPGSMPPPIPPGAMPPPNPYAYAPPAGAQPPPGWTPPPKPGLIPLRPLTLGTLLGASFQVMRRNPRPTFGFALLLAGFISVVSVIGITIAGNAINSRPFQGGSVDDQITLAVGGLFGGLLLGLLVPGALTLVAFSILQGVIALEVARGTLGEKLTLGGLWRAARGRIAVLVGWSVLIIAAITVFFIIVVFAVAGGMAGLAGGLGGQSLGSGDFGTVFGVVIAVTLLIYAIFGVLAAWFGVKTALVPSILIIERITLGRAIARSWRLTRRAFWRTFGTLLLVFVIVYFATSVVTTPVQLLFVIAGGVLTPTGGTAETALGTSVALIAVTTVVTVIVSAIGLIVQSAATALIYIDLRMRKEGLDLELARFVEARQAGDTTVRDPYLPPSTAAAPPATGTSPWS